MSGTTRELFVRMKDRQRKYEPLLFSPNSEGLQRFLDKNWGVFEETGLSHSVAGWSVPTSRECSYDFGDYGG
jgi:hypothetical protein